jgi:hypothetical protein
MLSWLDYSSPLREEFNAFFSFISCLIGSCFLGFNVSLPLIFEGFCGLCMKPTPKFRLRSMQIKDGKLFIITSKCYRAVWEFYYFQVQNGMKRSLQT